MKLLAWLLALPLFLVVFIAPILGYLVQPWAPWWVQGANAQFQSPTIMIGNPGDGGGGVVPAPGVPVPLPGSGSPPAAGIEQLLLQIIQPWMGDPYVFGGCSMTRGADCSCFVQQTAARLGVSLPRTAQTQWNATDRTTTPSFGDLVFFQGTYDSPDRITHVGWYIGGNQMISEAEPAVGRQSLDSPFWRAHLAGFGRLRGLPPPGQA